MPLTSKWDLFFEIQGNYHLMKQCFTPSSPAQTSFRKTIMQISLITEYCSFWSLASFVVINNNVILREYYTVSAQIHLNCPRQLFADCFLQNFKRVSWFHLIKMLSAADGSLAGRYCQRVAGCMMVRTYSLLGGGALRVMLLTTRNWIFWGNQVTWADIDISTLKLWLVSRRLVNSVLTFFGS